nr:hypothetical protein [Tanacetum cinerariifolium]
MRLSIRRVDSVERAITTDASLVVAQESDNIIITQTTAMPNVDVLQGMDTSSSLRCQETIGGTPAQTRSERVLKQPNEPPLSKGYTSGSEEGRMEHTFELTDTVPPTPHDSPLMGGYTPGSDEGRMKILELTNICITEKLIGEIDKDENVNLVSEQGESTAKDKGKGIMQETELPKKIKKREMIQLSLDEELAQKRSGFNLQQESSKKQKLDVQTEEEDEAQDNTDQEVEEMKLYMKIVLDEEIEIDAIPLATKPLNIDKEDLEIIWKLVKDKHGNTRPKEDYERVLWGDIKVMFKPDIKRSTDSLLDSSKVDCLHTRRLMSTIEVAHSYSSSNEWRAREEDLLHASSLVFYLTFRGSPSLRFSFNPTHIPVLSFFELYHPSLRAMSTWGSHSKNMDVPTPMVEQAKLKPDLVGKPVEHTDYRSMIGSLMYVTSSRPDIMFPTCLWYPKDSGFDLTAYSDTDHAGCHLDRKTESEYVVVSGCCAQVLWMRTQLTDYGFFYDKVPIYCDSKSAIAIACNPVQRTRTKHIDVRYHFIKDHVEKGTIELYFVGSEYQLAALFTKSLPEARFKFLVEKLGMMSRET